MSPLSRRSFVARAASLLPVTHTALAASQKPYLQYLGVELYTVRNVILKDPAATLKAIQEIGYKEVEVVYATLDQIWPALEKTNLKAVSAHVDGAIFLDNDSSKLDAALASLKAKGFEYAVFPYVANGLRGGAETYKKMAEAFNKAAERVKSHGLTFCYHNHAFEFQPLGGGTTALEILLDGTDKKLVFLEMDIFWVSVAGHDPVELLKKYKGRVPLLHLKDKPSGTAVQFSEDVPKEMFKALGGGSIDIPAVLKTAAKSGVKHYFVEQDQTPGDPIDSLRQSYQYLSNLK